MTEGFAALFDGTHVNVGAPERGLTLIAALVLLALAVVRLPFKAVLALAGGAYLLLRGLRGYCFIYDWLGINTAVPAPAKRLHTNGPNPHAAPRRQPNPTTTAKETT